MIIEMQNIHAKNKIKSNDLYAHPFFLYKRLQPPLYSQAGWIQFIIFQEIIHCLL